MSEVPQLYPRVPIEADPEDVAAAEQVSGREASLWRDAGRQLIRNPAFVIAAVLILIFVFIALFPQLLAPQGVGRELCSVRDAEQAPSAQYIFGLDEQGCPYYPRVIYGVRPSIIIGPVVTLIAVTIALTFGTLAGYYGGFLDTVVARITDIILALPLILGALVLLTAFRNVDPDDPEVNSVVATLARFFDAVDGFVNVRGIGLLMFVLAILGWTTMLRLARSSVLANKDSDFVEAARALGASDLRIMTRHVLPNSLAPVLVYASITVGTVIVGEAALSFLGVGLVRPAISWGLQLSVAQNRIQGAPHLMLFPGAFLAVLVFSFILMGDALRDALDPKLR
ncbi:ABC transporter permease [soil metagenome]